MTILSIKIPKTSRSLNVKTRKFSKIESILFVNSLKIANENKINIKYYRASLRKSTTQQENLPGRDNEPQN